MKLARIGKRESLIEGEWYLIQVFNDEQEGLVRCNGLYSPNRFSFSGDHRLELHVDWLLNSRNRRVYKVYFESEDSLPEDCCGFHYTETIRDYYKISENL